jgi:PAS domain S-box-containing protein
MNVQPESGQEHVVAEAEENSSEMSLALTSTDNQRHRQRAVRNLLLAFRDWIDEHTFTPGWIPIQLQHPAFGYLVAVVAETAAIFLTFLLVHIFSPYLFPGLFEALAIAFVALIWGIGPGLLATLVGVVLLDFVILPPQFAFILQSINEIIALLLFLIVGLVICIAASLIEYDRREAQSLANSLATERAHIEAIIETVPDAVSIHDTNGRIVRLNTMGQRNAGSNRGSEPMAEHPQLFEVQTPDGVPLTEQDLPVARALQGEIVSSMELHYLDADGHARYASISAAPLHDRQGSIEGAVVITHDITPVRQAELRTQKTLKALLDMAEALVLEPDSSTPSGQLMLSTLDEGKSLSSVQVSRIAHRMAELTRSVLGCERVSITSVDERTHEIRSLAAVGLSLEQAQQWEARLPGFTLSELATIDKDAVQPSPNSIRIIDMTQPPFDHLSNPYNIHTMLLASMNIGDQLIGILSLDYGQEDHKYSAEEITLAKTVARLTALVLERERLLLEREESQATELALREANRRMDDFLGMTSHELKTPLTSIKGNTQLTLRQITKNLQNLQTMQGMLESTERQARLLDRLVNDLLDISRAQSDHLEMEMNLCDLAMIVREAIEEQQHIWLDRSIVLDIPEELDTSIVADADRIKQVVNNYLNNALKYSSEEKPVSVSLRTDQEQVRLSVHDEGAGLGIEAQEHIWERFHKVEGIVVRSSAESSTSGLGLGLYISKAIIEQHHGQVGVESSPSNGSTFWFTLPLASEEQRD